MGSNMTPFKMTMTLATPVVMPFSTTLDGLLSFACEALTGKRDAELAEVIPLDDIEGVFKASSIFLSDEAFYENLIKVRSLKHLDLDLSLIGPRLTKSGKPTRSPYPKIDKSRGEYANKLEKMTTLRTPRAVCYGVGDIEAIKLLMECVIGLGRHAQQGQGEIIGVDIVAIDEDLSWVSSEGQPQRPIPVSAWEAHGESLEGVTTTLAPARFPYWEQPLESCVAPVRTVTRV